MDTAEKRYHILKYSSMLHRHSQAFFNEQLKNTGIGAGQQYFLDRIARHPGITVTQLAQTAGYDNGTSAKAVKKLLDEEYILMKTDEADGRVKRLYPTEKAAPVVEKIREMKKAWRAKLTQGFSDEEKDLLSALLKRLAENAAEGSEYAKEGESEP